MENTYMKESRAEELIAREAEYGLFMDLLLNTASLAFGKNRLYFNGDVIRAFLMAVDPDGYKNRLDELLKEAEEDE